MSQQPMARGWMGRWRWWVGALVGLLFPLLFAGVLLSRAAAPASPADQALAGNDVAGVLSQATLPSRFSYAGMAWEAVQVVRLAPSEHLVPVEPALFGRVLFARRGAPTNPPRTLYLPVAQQGPYAGLYLRYNPVP
ncbi:MAG: hypothetical protein GX774_16665 [Armatimonadetes bacterium]|jgi:hypothetical protein|nr:hypothetical protein [Armatimonadota bacterium]